MSPGGVDPRKPGTTTMPHTTLLLCLLLLLPPVARALNVADAAHLLRRTGFGATPAEVEALLPLSRREAVRRVLHGAPGEDWCVRMYLE